MLLRPSLWWMLFRTFLPDILLQAQIFRQDRPRWAVHMTFFWDMPALLFIHVFDDSLLAPLLDHYASTLNPWMFLRNLLGLLVLVSAIIYELRNEACRRLGPPAAQNQFGGSFAGGTGSQLVGYAFGLEPESLGLESADIIKS